MTLALHGKTKQRQAGLLLLGLVAILLASVAGVAWMNSKPAAADTINSWNFNVANNGDVPDWTDDAGATIDGNRVRLANQGSISRVISTVGYSNITVDFTCTGEISGNASDNLVVEYSTNSGTTWNAGLTLSSGLAGQCNALFQDLPYTLDLSSVSAADNIATFALRFRAASSTGDPNAFLAWTWDDILIDNIVVNGDAPDADGDGVSDADDICPDTLDGAPGVNADGCDFAQQLEGTVATNPAPPTTCDVAFSIVIDRSASFSNGELALTLSETEEFIEGVFAIPGNSPTFRIVGFSDNAIVPGGTQPYTTETDAVTALNSIGTGTYTNWAAGLTAGDGAEVQWMIVITDGNPNRPGASNDVSFGALQAAVNAANTVKGGGAHITVVGVDTTGNEPNGFGPISQSYAALVGNGDVKTGGLADLADILATLTADCDPPSTVVKEFVGLNATGTEASWTVEATNNSTTETRSFYLVELVEATLWDQENCSNGPSLPTSILPPDETPWRCDVGPESTGTYHITTPVDIDLCKGGGVLNRYWVRIEDGQPMEGTVEYTVPGNEEECDREIIVDKNFVGLAGYVPDEDDVPDLDLPAGVTIKSEGFLDADTYRWVLNAPIDASGEVTEINIPGFWMQVDNEECFIVDLTDPQALVIQEQIIEIPVADCVFENQPFGTLIINKADGTSDGSLPWDFTVQNLPPKAVDGTDLDSTPQASENTPSMQVRVPLSQLDLFVTEDDFRLESLCAEENTYFSAVIGPNPDQKLTFPGDEVIWNFSNQPCGVLGTGGIIIEKWEDVNGDGIISAGDQRLPGWTFTTTGAGGEIPGPNQVRVTNASGQILDYVSGFDAGTVLTVSESLPPGWVFVSSHVEGEALSFDSSPSVTIIGGETLLVRLLNERARVNIVATKTIYNNANPGGANGGAGWQFTLTGCGIASSAKVTDASGTVSWTNLPAAINCSYTVTETAKAGWVADDLQKSVAPVNDGETVTVGFINRQVEGCLNIQQCPQTFDETPTPTNTPTTPVTGETPTTTDPTATNTPEEDVEGEKTPGPGGESTPIAPDTGDGIAGVGAGWNMLLVIAGLIAISGGLSMIALGRRTVRTSD